MSVAVCAVAVSACGGNSAPECNAATRGCVQLTNTTTSPAVFVADGITTNVGPGTDAAPEIGWASIDPTVGVATKFAVSTGGVVKYATCTNSAATWSNPNTPPKVTWVYTGNSLLAGIYYPTCSGW